jgi:hypothetical protein
LVDSHSSTANISQQRIVNKEVQKKGSIKKSNW